MEEERRILIQNENVQREMINRILSQEEMLKVIADVEDEENALDAKLHHAVQKVLDDLTPE